MKRAFALALLVPLVAFAHAVDHQRVAFVELSRDAITIQLKFQLSQKDAEGAKQLFDRNRNGTLEPSEAALLHDYLEKRAIGSFHVSIAGNPVPLERVPSSTNPAEENPCCATVTLRARADFSKRTGLTIEDAGDAQGHLPVVVKTNGVHVRTDLPMGNVFQNFDGYDLPARKPVDFVVTPS